MENHEPWTLTARWIVPVDAAPLEMGTITIAGNRIVSIETKGRRRADNDLGNAAILPGFVNAHTHLDLTGLRARVPPTDHFIDWLGAVIRHRRSLSTEQVLVDTQDGL